MTKSIPLSRGLTTIVDDQDYEKLSKYKWSAQPMRKKGIGWYAVRTAKDSCGKYITVRMHRAILNMPLGATTDHKNGDGLDNRRANLRVCNSIQNACNREKSRNTSSRFKGVTWDKLRQKWAAQVVRKGKKHFLGRFIDECQAAQAYNEYVSTHYGEFARLNDL